MEENHKDNVDELSDAEADNQKKSTNNMEDDELLENIEIDSKDTSSAISELESKLKDLQNKDLRLKAEFDNFRKRTIKEKESIYISAQADCITPLLSVLDNLERALESVKDNVDLSKGIKLVTNQFYDALKKLGVVEIESDGKTFDPSCHNAINVIEDENFDHNTVCQVLQKGYKLKDTVIRHAMVIVANP